MPRKKPEPPAIEKRFSIEHVEIAAAHLVTIDSDHGWWKGHAGGGNFRGAIVRLRPPIDTPAEMVATIRALVEQGGAIAVRVLPTRRSEIVTQQRARHAQKVTARDVAKVIVAASSHPDRAALLARVEARLDEVGL